MKNFIIFIIIVYFEKKISCLAYCENIFAKNKKSNLINLQEVSAGTSGLSSAPSTSAVEPLIDSTYIRVSFQLLIDLQNQSYKNFFEILKINEIK